MNRSRRCHRTLAGLLLALSAAALPAAAGAEVGTGVDFAPVACPAEVAAVAECHEGQDANGAWLLAAIPRDWNRHLVVHAHGGPRLHAPRRGDSAEDLARFAAMVRAGHAWIGSTYRRGGYGVRSAAADVEASRHAFVARWGQPDRTLLHGQSWGGNVAAKLAELQALELDGRPRYDAVLTTNGVLTGGNAAYGFRADLRAIYQYYCRNHPGPDEPAYPLWQGLPADATLDRDALARRVDACTGISQPAARRTPAQAARLADILAVSGVAETQLVAHLAWGTFHFRDLVQRRLGGRNPFDNRQTRYAGSRDDEALNAGIARFEADPQARALLGYDADLSGQIVLPTLALHAARDPVVAATALEHYRARVEAAGAGHLLLVVRVDDDAHSLLRDAVYLSALQVLHDWLDSGRRPPVEALPAACAGLGSPEKRCGFLVPGEASMPGNPETASPRAADPGATG